TRARERLPRKSESRTDIAFRRSVHDGSVVAIADDAIGRSSGEISRSDQSGEGTSAGEIIVGDLGPEIHQVSVRVYRLPEYLPAHAKVQRQLAADLEIIGEVRRVIVHPDIAIRDSGAPRRRQDIAKRASVLRRAH